ncbi:YybH family protein [Aestuariivivens sediminicola]|uniref:YybH family protein n=1 Tax=Aestuariivivens sediminicola TaxID=2913560 RepID=UPI001F5AD1AB|nr:nuclear transport factor 2 family protein [Aestuariivivens sediminicola]
MKSYVIILVSICFLSCKNEVKDPSALIVIWKNELFETERQFSAMAQKEGMRTAFLNFAADEAVLLRNDSLIKGRPGIAYYMKNANSKGLHWEPEFADVSASGDLGYTYGEYTYSYTDSTGTVQTARGIFHTVWKRQADNSWKFVWD